MQIMNCRFSITLLGLLFFFSCNKEEIEFQSTGVITGPDLAYCACCGGYLIEIADSSYHFDALPGSATINIQNETFPIAVNLNWKYERKCGYFQYIKITQIEKQ